MLTKEISEVEKEIEIADSFNKGITPTSKEKEEFLKRSVDLYDYKSLTQIRQLVLEEKLSTLKSAQAKFNRFVEDLKEEGCKRCLRNRTIVLGTFYNLIDELSSKQEEKE
jgi:hypothetical protein